MAQIFSRKANTLAWLSLLAVVVVLLGALWMAGVLFRSEWVTLVNVPRGQPVPFSHRHHVGGLGLDCRYCHVSVQKAAFAGMPSTHTCMTCHSQIWKHSPMLAPVRASFRTGLPLRWTQVYNLPQYVYFDHSIHVDKGIGCETCHGRVDRMPITMAHKAFWMQTCINCHRNPRPFLRPLGAVFTMGWQRPSDDPRMGNQLFRAYHIRSAQALTQCDVCHR